MTNDEINKQREKINDLDDKILSLLNERSQIVNAIGKFKDKSKSVVDVDREKSILARLQKEVKGHYSKDTIVRIWRELFYASSQIQIDSDSKIFSKRGIDDIKIYKGGQATLEGHQNVIKLSSNENAIGPSPNIFKMMLKEISLNRYPQIDGQSLRTQLAKLHSINSEQIILGNGSDEILLLTALAFCHPGDEIIHSKYGFEMYPIISKVVGALSIIAEENNYTVSIDSILRKITVSTKVIFIDNPNNPTGTYLDKNNLIELLLKIPQNIIVVIDGAYAEYVTEKNYDNGFELINRFENLLITRTFSKVYGLAGIRLGWCYTSKKIASILNKIKPPFNSNAIALKIASIALEDKQHITKVINENKQTKEWFENKVKKLNISCLRSASNFTFIECNKNSNEAEKINNLFLKNGIIIRQLHSYGLPNCLRITIGTKQEMEKAIDILTKGHLEI